MSAERTGNYGITRMRSVGRRLVGRSEAKIVEGTSPEAIVGLLRPATWEDSLPSDVLADWTSGNTYLLPSPRDFATIDNPSSSSFSNLIIMKLSRLHGIAGTTGMLPRNQAVMLDRAWYDNRDIYSIRVPDDGTLYTFEADAKIGVRGMMDPKHILAEGISRFVNASPDELQASRELLDEIVADDQKRHAEVLEYLESGRFFRDYDRASRGEFGDTDSQ